MDLHREAEMAYGNEPERLAEESLVVSPPLEIGPLISTPLLRQCTALATRARVDLLSGSRHEAAEQLEGVLETLALWDAGSLRDPDPTMVVLAAAALQDLAERLVPSSTNALSERIEAALRLLHTLMDPAHIDAMA